MKTGRPFTLAFALTLVIPVFAAGQAGPITHHVSASLPVEPSGASRELSAERAIGPSLPTAKLLPSPSAHKWQLQATLPRSVIHDLSFASPTVGFAAAEAGQIWKTTNGGKTWTVRPIQS